MIQLPVWFVVGLCAIVGIAIVTLVSILISAIASNMSLDRRATTAEAKLAKIGEGLAAILNPPDRAPSLGPEDDADLLALWLAVTRR